jgi:hypothetical protein
MKEIYKQIGGKKNSDEGEERRGDVREAECRAATKHEIPANC